MGQALSVAMRDISWSKEPAALKMLFIVGNGVINLGGDEYIRACEKAVGMGVMVNAVYCKTYTNIREIVQWKEIAEIGKGDYYEIDINKKTFSFVTPYDVDVMNELNFLLGRTYVYYGAQGMGRFKIQKNLDSMTAAINDMTFQERLVTKSSKYYQGKNYSWDLVDYFNKQKRIFRSPKTDFSKLNRSTLPYNLQTRSDNDLKKYIDEKLAERLQIIETMKMLGLKRKNIVKEKKKTLKIAEGNTLGQVVIDALTKAAPDKGFVIGN